VVNVRGVVNRRVGWRRIFGFARRRAYVLSGAMSRKSAKIAALIEECRGQELDAHYLGYFVCFNRGLYYEAHDVLEELWLPLRQQPEGDFYKGLIQLAGAFVHLQKNRLRPATALFKLARTNLAKYPPRHERLDVKEALAMTEDWVGEIERLEFASNPLGGRLAPRLELTPAPVRVSG
jgi:predicted metal-dependent hydrolase